MLNTVDWLAVTAYFALVFGIALWAARRPAARRSAGGYFLADRNVGWWVVGASLFASNIGSEHLIGLAGTGAARGVAVAQFEVLASLVLLLLGWVFVPFYLRSGVSTMPEFLERRYSPAARWLLAVVSVVGYVLTKISVAIAAGGIVFEALMGVSFWTGALVVVVDTGLYTVLGGLRAVLYTDVLQTVVLIGGAVLVTLTGLSAVGGWGALTAAAGPEAMAIWKPMSDPDFPWTGIALGAPILGVWYWCTDQYIVQRVLAASDETEARRGTIFGGFLKILPLFIFVLPGVIAQALATSGRLDLAEPDQALPVLVSTLLPAGLRGIVVAGLLAALMSSLSSVFNSCATLVTLDIYRPLRPAASEQQLVRVGQLASGGLVVLGLLWIPMMGVISGQLYQYLQSVQAYLAPPIAAVFLIGLFWRRANGRGAMAALLTGFGLGAARLLAELRAASLSGWVASYASINFLHFAALLFLVCVVVLMAVSLSAPATPREQLGGLTYASTSPAHREGSTRADLSVSILVVVLVAAIWLYF